MMLTRLWANLKPELEPGVPPCQRDDHWHGRRLPDSVSHSSYYYCWKYTVVPCRVAAVGNFVRATQRDSSPSPGIFRGCTRHTIQILMVRSGREQAGVSPDLTRCSWA